MRYALFYVIICVYTCRSKTSPVVLAKKRVKCCFAYVEWYFQIFKKFVDIFYKTKASLYFNVKVMICLASFDACLLGIQKGQDINNKEKV